jgi:tRNA (guanine9-N1)-methyltransferase
MEAEERPAKLRKLSHGASNEQPQTEPPMATLPADVIEDDAEQPQKRPPAEFANGIDANDSSHNSSEDPHTNLDGSNSDPFALLPGPDLAPNSGLSKNQLKKLRKKQEWEAGRDERKVFRKQKTQEKKARKRAARDATIDGTPSTNGETLENGQDTSSRSSLRSGVPKHASGTLLPITLIIDCAFDKLMHDKERISLASQITRSYSDNHRAPFKAHLVISSFSGELKNRFDTVLHKHYENWKGVRVLEEDFVDAAQQSKEWMRSAKRGGKLAGAFAQDAEHGQSTTNELEAQGEVVYLTSDSEKTLDRLKPYSTYIIGGLVDKNRHKGICHKSACDRGVKTAKLPIGQYMDMQSRFVLATNHVVEIMIRWLEFGDWGEAFLKVVPKRKGGKLKQMGVLRKGGEPGEGEGEGEGGDDVSEDGKEQEVGEDRQEVDEGESGNEAGKEEDGAPSIKPSTPSPLTG